MKKTLVLGNNGGFKPEHLKPFLTKLEKSEKEINIDQGQDIIDITELINPFPKALWDRRRPPFLWP